ncbi:Subtilisin-like protease SBT2-4 [Nymphaea thermarum]|nr:Subtilisin-like protease SBT2-4 [Nymphaea thermarum]
MSGSDYVYHIQVEISAISFPGGALLRKVQSEQEVMDHHDQLLKSTLDTASYQKLYSFYYLINGFAIHTTVSQVAKLRAIKEVRTIEKDRGARLMTTYTPTFLGLPAGAWAREGGPQNAGEGIVIGLVDSGIDPTHPSFANTASDPFLPNIPRFSGTCQTGPLFPENSCNGKIISARYFSAGAAALMPLNASKDFFHVAAIAAANSGVQVIVDGFNYGSASGMAPRARIAVYKALYPDIATLADVLSAIDQASQDGVDILSLSVGPDEPPKDSSFTMLNVFDVMLMFAQRAGIFVVQAAGNKGPDAGTVISFSPWVMGVAACHTDRTYAPYLLLGNYLTSTFTDYKLVSAKDAAVLPNVTAEECQNPDALMAEVVQGSILICSFSAGFFQRNSTIYAVLRTASKLGAMGFVLVANPLYGDFTADPVPFSIPGIMIPRVSDAQALMEYYENKTHRDETGVAYAYGATASVRSGREASFNEKEAPIVSRFSSRGPGVNDLKLSPSDILKPEILAPGHTIWAAWSPISMVDPLLKGYSFAPLSGTSMAAPHVAGIAALVKELHPSWTPAMVASALVTTASKYDNKGNPIMAEGSYSNTGNLYPATPFDYGAGLINAAAAMDPGLAFQSDFEDYISFLCAMPNMDPQAVQDATGMQCNNSLAYPSDLNLPSITIGALKGDRSVWRNVTNVASGTETYLCSVLPPRGVEVQVLPSFFTIAPQETQDLEIKLSVVQALNVFSFGEIVLIGSLDHMVRLPLTVFTLPVH